MANFELDDRDREIIARMDELTREVIPLWWGLPEQSPATTAIGALFVRASASWKSICMILLRCEDAEEMRLCSNDVAALLRCMHDVCVQAEYIAAGDPTEGLSANDLGQLYREFEHIERHRMAKKAVTLKSKVAKILASSPHRSAGEARNQAEYDRVKSKYPDKRHWYKGTFVQLAKKVGREEDEFLFTQLLHPSTAARTRFFTDRLFRVLYPSWSLCTSCGVRSISLLRETGSGCLSSRRRCWRPSRLT